MGINTEYTELSSAKISSSKNLVLSVCKMYGKVKGYTLAQQMDVNDDNKTIKVFLKNSVHISDLDGLYNLRDALNQAIEKVENSKKQKSEKKCKKI